MEKRIKLFISRTNVQFLLLFSHENNYIIDFIIAKLVLNMLEVFLIYYPWSNGLQPRRFPLLLLLLLLSVCGLHQSLMILPPWCACQF